MKASVYSNTLLIGETDLQVGDESMGCVYGEFIPNANYFEKVQQYVWQFWSNNKPDNYQWRSLRFNVQLENGYFLYPMGGYTIDDMEELPGKVKRIDIAGLFRHVIEDFFHTDPPRHFVEDPWVAITIQQKISFEDELQSEIKSTYNSVTLKRHVLVDYDYSAICKSIRVDDVLFAINKRGDLVNNFALIHLSYNRESDPRWPSTTFFESFDEFKFRRMYPDKAEWED